MNQMIIHDYIIPSHLKEHAFVLNLHMKYKTNKEITENEIEQLKSLMRIETDFFGAEIRLNESHHHYNEYCLLLAVLAVLSKSECSERSISDNIVQHIYHKNLVKIALNGILMNDADDTLINSLLTDE